jgi:uncharacterized protein
MITGTFINREQELSVLEKAYSSPASAFVVIYGRRRVGKTALISNFLQGKKAVYFLATQEADHINRASFQEQLAHILPLPYLQSAENISWQLMFEEIARHSKRERLIIALDEFQYLGVADRAFPSLFQKIWDNTLKNANVMVIICGSLLSLMESQALNYNSPLYGRRTAQIRLGSLDFRHYRDFYPNHLSPQELLWRYGVTGGVPRYIEALRTADDGTNLNSFWQAVQTEILNPGALLYEEPYFLLSREVKELGSYFSLLKTIAAGNHKLGKIAASLGVKEMNLRHHLKTLIDLGIIKKLVPVTEKYPEKSKLSLYMIKDEFLRFWFRFIYPNKSYLEIEQTEPVLKKIKERYLEEHLSYVYETVCLQDLIQRAPQEMPHWQLNRFGKWWNRNEEIDLVAFSEELNLIAFGECKMTGKPVDVDLLYNLRLKAARVNWGKENRKEGYFFYSYSGYTERFKQLATADDSVRLLTLNQTKQQYRRL